MAQDSNPTADALANREYAVLDKGFVRLANYSGGDARIVHAARVSYGVGTKTLQEQADGMVVM